MSGFESPTLKIAQIIPQVKEWDININEADFQKPDPRRWMEIYSRIYNVLSLRCIEDSVQEFMDHAMFKVEHNHKDLYDEGLTQIGFSLFMNRMFVSCGYQDFSVQDLVEPSRKRLIKMLSAFINKVRNDDLVRGTFEDMKYRCLQSKEEHDKVIHNHNELKLRYDKMKISEGQIEEQMAKLNEESEKMIVQMGECKRQAEAEQKSIDEIKLIKSEKTALKEKYRSAIKEIEQEVEKISQKIVQSPDQFKQEHGRLRKRVEELKDSFDHKCNEKSNRISLLEKTLNNKIAAEKASKQGKEVISDLEKAKEIVTEIEKAEEKLQEIKYEMSYLCTDFDDVKENIALRQNQKHTLTQQLDLRKQCGQQHKEDVERNFAMYQEKLDSIKCEEDQIKKAIGECKQASAGLDEQVDKMSREIKTEQEGIYQEMDILHDKVALVYEQFGQIFEDDN